MTWIADFTVMHEQRAIPGAAASQPVSMVSSTRVRVMSASRP
jgi:hypothetical protein